MGGFQFFPLFILPPSFFPPPARARPRRLRWSQEHGHIYMHRFRPTDVEMRAHPVGAYPARSRQAACLMHMVQNNLDPAVAQYPHELVTYGGNGSAFGNWAQYRLTMRALAAMGDDQTLCLYSGHPMGLFPSHPDAPRLVVTNGMVGGGGWGGWLALLFQGAGEMKRGEGFGVARQRARRLRGEDGGIARAAAAHSSVAPFFYQRVVCVSAFHEHARSGNPQLL